MASELTIMVAFHFLTVNTNETIPGAASYCVAELRSRVSGCLERANK